LESLKEASASASVLESLSKLRSLVEDYRTTSLSPKIFDITRAIEETMTSHTNLIEDIHHDIQAAKDNVKTSLVLSEIGALKDAALENTSSLLTIHDSVGAIDRKIKDSEGVIISSVHNVHIAVDAVGSNRKEDSDVLAADVKALNSSLETSTNGLQADVKAVISLVQNNGQTVEKNFTTISDVGRLAETLADDMKSLLTEHLPNLRRDLQAIDLSKLHHGAAETGKVVNSIDDTVQELSKTAKGHETQLSELDHKVTGINDLFSSSLMDLQTAVEALDSTLVKLNQGTTQEMTKNKDLLLTHIDGNLQQASLQTETLTSQISTLQNELQSLHVAIDKSRIETVQAMENGNGVLASSINENISGTFSTLETQLSGSISILDKFLTKAITSTIEKGEVHTATLETINSSLSSTTSEIATLNSSISKTHIPSVLSAIGKTRALISSHAHLLDNVKSDILSNNTSTAATLSTLSSSMEDLSTTIGNTTAAVRVNSAAISRVDRAVLETGAQVKSVVLEGNSKLSREIDVALEQLDERLHDSGTRIIGITDIDLPRLEETVKGLEGMVERTMGGNLKAVGRNRDALSVIGARVIGTQKMFEEMVEAHAGREEGGSRSLEGSGILRPGFGDHRRMPSGRFRAGSNASSGKDTAGSGLKGLKHDKHP
jgi:predicted  nucleic acid-binding Zn-ribbon protein